MIIISSNLVLLFNIHFQNIESSFQKEKIVEDIESITFIKVDFLSFDIYYLRFFLQTNSQNAHLSMIKNKFF